MQPVPRLTEEEILRKIEQYTKFLYEKQRGALKNSSLEGSLVGADTSAIEARIKELNETLLNLITKPPIDTRSDCLTVVNLGQPLPPQILFATRQIISLATDPVPPQVQPIIISATRVWGRMESSIQKDKFSVEIMIENCQVHIMPGTMRTVDGYGIGAPYEKTDCTYLGQCMKVCLVQTETRQYHDLEDRFKIDYVESGSIPVGTLLFKDGQVTSVAQNPKNVRIEC